MSKYTEKALELHARGYNCAQAVVCAFKDKLDMDETALYKIAEGFGSGIGNRKYLCGALTGAVMVSGLASSSGDAQNSTKKQTYKISSEIADYFQVSCGGVNCEDIKGINTGKVKASCQDCILFAVKAVEDIVFGK